jgi:hypothetical protein
MFTQGVKGEIFFDIATGKSGEEGVFADGVRDGGRNHGKDFRYARGGNAWCPQKFVFLDIPLTSVLTSLDRPFSMAVRNPLIKPWLVS